MYITKSKANTKRAFFFKKKKRYNDMLRKKKKWNYINCSVKTTKSKRRVEDTNANKE